MKSIAYSVRMAVATLFQGFRSSETKETAWARRLMKVRELPDEILVREVSAACRRHCPDLPVEYLPFVTELLAAAMRLARRDAGLPTSMRRSRLRRSKQVRASRRLIGSPG